METNLATLPTKQPVMVFHPGSTLDDNPSNWWSPNEACFTEMMRAVGVSELEVISRAPPHFSDADLAVGRIAVRGRAPTATADVSSKMLPRRPTSMPVSRGQGNRRNVER